MFTLLYEVYPNSRIYITIDAHIYVHYNSVEYVPWLFNVNVGEELVPVSWLILEAVDAFLEVLTRRLQQAQHTLHGDTSIL